MPGNQCLGVKLLYVSGRNRPVLNDEQLPLSHKSALAWIGFSAEGTPFAVDSSGVVRMLNRAFSNTWVQVANTRKTVSSGVLSVPLDFLLFDVQHE